MTADIEDAIASARASLSDCADRLEQALTLRSFPRPRRDIAERQVSRLRRAASGEVAAAVFEADSLTFGSVRDRRRHPITEDTPSGDPRVDEMNDLRSLCHWEAQVFDAHWRTSSPATVKKVCAFAVETLNGIALDHLSTIARRSRSTDGDTTSTTESSNGSR